MDQADIGEVNQAIVKIEDSSPKKQEEAAPIKQEDPLKQRINENWQSMLADIRRKKALTETPLTQFLHRAKRWTVGAVIGGLLMLDDVGQMAEPFISTSTPALIAEQAFERGKVVLDDFNMEAADKELEQESLKDTLSRKNQSNAGASPDPQQSKELFSEK